MTRASSFSACGSGVGAGVSGDSSAKIQISFVFFSKVSQSHTMPSCVAPPRADDSP
jgi:hypothetical protein